jgi:very-short-patch-repair endonuclease
MKIWFDRKVLIMSSMFYDASPEIFARARSLRANMTKEETRLWELLKTHYKNYKFRRQHPMGPYIADFYCHKLKLVIELDGKHHLEDENQMVYDRQRDEDMKKWGVTILRYPNSVNHDLISNEINRMISQFPPTP